MFRSIGAMPAEAAARRGERVAVVADGRPISFAGLDAQAARFASALAASGVGPGDVVTLYGPNCLEWLVAYYGIHRAGAVANPINVMLTPDEVGYIMADAGSRALVAAPEQGAPLVGRTGPACREIVLWGEAPAGATGFDAFLARGADAFTPVAAEPGALAAICYTSGTTGRPRGAMQSQRSLVAAAAGFALMSARTERDTAVSPLPCPHVYGSAVFNAALMTGTKLILLSRFTPAGALDAIEEHRATGFDGVPTAYYYLLAEPGFDRRDLSSLVRCTVGGQVLPAAKSEEFTRRTGAPVLELWGMTELSGAATMNPAHGLNKPGTIGVTVPGVAAKIAPLDDPAGEVPAGERGELLVRGPLVTMGYFNDPAATAEATAPGGWLRTGDVATMDEDGYLAIVDRKKDMILTAGYNVYPAEIERVLCMHEAVALAAVCGVPDEAKGELAKAFVVLKPGASATGAELARHCRRHLAAYKAPRAVQFVATVPITSSGKIMRRLLRDQDDGSRSLGE